MDAIRSLIQGYWADAVVATEAQTKGRSLFENIGPYVMGNFAAMEDRWRRQKVFDDESLETRRSADLRIVLVTKAIEKEKESVPIASPLIVSCDSRYYALHQNGLLFRERLKARSSNDLPNPCECQRHWRDYAEAANAYVKIVRRRHMASIQQNSAALKVLAPLETEAAKAATGKAVLTS